MKKLYQLEKKKMSSDDMFPYLVIMSLFTMIPVSTIFTGRFKERYIIDIALFLIVDLGIFINIICRVKKRNTLIQHGKLIMAEITEIQHSRTGALRIKAKQKNDKDGKTYIFSQRDKLRGLPFQKLYTGMQNRYEIGVVVDSNDWSDYYMLIFETAELVSRMI